MIGAFHGLTVSLPDPAAAFTSIEQCLAGYHRPENVSDVNCMQCALKAALDQAYTSAVALGWQCTKESPQKPSNDEDAREQRKGVEHPRSISNNDTDVLQPVIISDDGHSFSEQSSLLYHLQRIKCFFNKLQRHLQSQFLILHGITQTDFIDLLKNVDAKNEELQPL